MKLYMPYKTTVYSQANRYFLGHFFNDKTIISIIFPTSVNQVFKCIPTRPLYKALVYYHGLSHDCFTLCSSLESLKLVTRRWLAMMTKMEKTLLQMYLHSLSCIKNSTEKIVTVLTGCLTDILQVYVLNVCQNRYDDKFC